LNLNDLLKIKIGEAYVQTPKFEVLRAGNQPIGEGRAAMPEDSHSHSKLVKG
jgi:hypothetical protein